MSQKFTLKHFVKNVGSGWLAMLVVGVVGFVTLPLSMKYLGNELYGVAALVTAFLSVFQFLSFGLPPTLLRFFSLALAKEDSEEFRKIVSVSFIVLGGLGLLGTLIFLGCYWKFLDIYDISPEYRSDLLFLYVITALHFLQTFVIIPFYAIIQAKNRFDFANYRRILAALLKLVTLWLGFIFLAPTLRVLAYSLICSIAYELISVFWIAYKLEGSNIIPRLSYWSWDILKGMLVFSVDSLINTIFYPLSIQLPILIIGHTLGKEHVTHFYPAVVLGNISSTLLMSLGSPLTPLASKDKVTSGGSNLGRWATIIGETVGCVGCLIILGCYLMGFDLITLWLGSEFVSISGATIVAIVFGIVYAQVQATNFYLALGSSTIKPVAYSSVVMAVLTGLGTYVGTVYFNWSIFGVAICIAVVRVLRNTFYLAWTYSKLFNYNYLSYTWRVYCKPTMLALCLAFVGYWVRLQLPEYTPTFFTLILGAIVISFVYGVLAWYFVISSDIKKYCRFLRKAPKFVRTLLMWKE